jgi:DNA-binding transcriptional ArsR family regulator
VSDTTDNQSAQRPGRKTSGVGRRAFEAKWGAEVAEAGFVMVPALLLERVPELKLTATQLQLLIVLIRFWYFSDKMPFPSVARLAQLTGLSERSVQRSMSSLRKAGLIAVRQGRKRNGEALSNIYDLSPLIARLQRLAQLADERRATRSGDDLPETDDSGVIDIIDEGS